MVDLIVAARCAARPTTPSDASPIGPAYLESGPVPVCGMVSDSEKGEEEGSFFSSSAFEECSFVGNEEELGAELHITLNQADLAGLMQAAAEGTLGAVAAEGDGPASPPYTARGRAGEDQIDAAAFTLPFAARLALQRRPPLRRRPPDLCTGVIEPRLMGSVEIPCATNSSTSGCSTSTSSGNIGVIVAPTVGGGEHHRARGTSPARRSRSSVASDEVSTSSELRDVSVVLHEEGSSDDEDTEDEVGLLQWWPAAGTGTGVAFFTGVSATGKGPPTASRRTSRPGWKQTAGSDSEDSRGNSRANKALVGWCGVPCELDPLRDSCLASLPPGRFIGRRTIKL